MSFTRKLFTQLNRHGHLLCINSFESCEASGFVSLFEVACRVEYSCIPVVPLVE